MWGNFQRNQETNSESEKQFYLEKASEEAALGYFPRLFKRDSEVKFSRRLAMLAELLFITSNRQKYKKGASLVSWMRNPVSQIGEPCCPKGGLFFQVGNFF